MLTCIWLLIFIFLISGFMLFICIFPILVALGADPLYIFDYIAQAKKIIIASLIIAIVLCISQSCLVSLWGHSIEIDSDERQIVSVPFSNNENIYAIKESQQYTLYYLLNPEEELQEQTINESSTRTIFNKNPKLIIVTKKTKIKYISQDIFDFLFYTETKEYILQLPNSSSILSK